MRVLWCMLRILPCIVPILRGSALAELSRVSRFLSALTIPVFRWRNEAYPKIWLKAYSFRTLQ